VFDQASTASAFTAATVAPLITGGAYDYWQIEGNTPTSPVIVNNIVRCLPGGLPQAGTNGGYTAGGYIGGPSTTTTAITGGAGVGATTFTVGAVPASMVIGGIVNLTGGAASEAFYINNIVSTTITISVSPTSQQGTIQIASHTNAVTGFASDADVANFNADITSVIGEFPTTVVVADMDTPISSNSAHYFTDGLHLNDRGQGFAGQATVTALEQINVTTLTTYGLAAAIHASRGWRKPENHFQVHSGILGLADYALSTLNAWTDLDAVNYTVLMTASPGDDIMVELSGLWQTATTQAKLDVALCNQAGNPIRYASSNVSVPALLGVGSWYGIPNAIAPVSGKVIIPAVQSSEFVTAFTVNGVVELKLRYNISGNRTLFANSASLIMTVTNIGMTNSVSYI
jgi:hypothetical protein